MSTLTLTLTGAAPTRSPTSATRGGIRAAVADGLLDRRADLDRLLAEVEALDRALDDRE